MSILSISMTFVLLCCKCRCFSDVGFRTPRGFRFWCVSACDSQITFASTETALILSTLPLVQLRIPSLLISDFTVSLSPWSVVLVKDLPNLPCCTPLFYFRYSHSQLCCLRSGLVRTLLNDVTLPLIVVPLCSLECEAFHLLSSRCGSFYPVSLSLSVPLFNSD